MTPPGTDGPGQASGRLAGSPPLAEIVNSLQIAILVVDERGIIVSANAHTERLLGYRQDELAGKLVEVLVPERLRGRHFAHREGFTNAPESRQMGAGRDLWAVRKDGTEIPVEIGLSPHSTPEGGVVLASIIDISARKRAESGILERERLLRAVMDNSSAVIYMKNVDGSYIMINRRYEELFHLTNEAVRGRKDHDIFPAELADRYRANDLRVIAERRSFQFTEFAPQDGGLHEYVSVKFPLFDADGGVHGMCGISTDVTALRRMERDLAHAEKLTALGQLAAGVAHEINTPLANILLVAESLQRRLADPAGRTKLQTIIDQVETSSRIVKGLLDFARKKEPVFGRVDLVQTVRDTILFIRGKMSGDVDILVEAPGEAVEVDGDRSQLTQVFANIVLNGIEAMGGKGRVTIRVTASGEEGAEAPSGEVTVEDEGPGLPKEALDHAFDPFFTTKGDHGGTGLGLSVAYGIVQAHHGTIELRNRPEGGARITVRLPVRTDAGAATD
jgi:PAS domain S-box-containing protein